MHIHKLVMDLFQFELHKKTQNSQEKKRNVPFLNKIIYSNNF